MIHEGLVEWDTSCAGTEVQDAATTSNCLGGDDSPVHYLYIGVKERTKKNTRVGGGSIAIHFLNILTWKIPHYRNS